jgi:hypothetical protein
LYNYECILYIYEDGGREEGWGVGGGGWEGIELIYTYKHIYI